MKKIILMADGYICQEVAKKIIQSGDIIVRLYLHQKGVGKLSKEIKAASNCSEVYYVNDLQKKNHINELKSLKADSIVTVYWAHLLKSTITKCAKELLTILRARSFGELGFAYYESVGKKIYLNLRLSDTIYHS